jgi:hypothetical protein
MSEIEDKMSAKIETTNVASLQQVAEFDSHIIWDRPKQLLVDSDGRYYLGSTKAKPVTATKALGWFLDMHAHYDAGWDPEQMATLFNLALAELIED